MQGAEEKLELLKHAYRTIKKEMKEREEEIEAERAIAQQERRALLTKVDSLERELEALKATVRSHGRAAETRLLELERERAPPPRAAAAPSSDQPALSSYERGMAWAGKVMNVKGTLSSALSSTVESVSTLATPSSVQLQVQRQQELFEAQAAVQQSLCLDLREAQAALARSDEALRAEEERREALRRVAEGAAARVHELEEALREAYARLDGGHAALHERYEQAIRAAAAERRAEQQQLDEVGAALRALLHDACVACEMARLSLHPSRLPDAPRAAASPLALLHHSFTASFTSAPLDGHLSAPLERTAESTESLSHGLAPLERSGGSSGISPAFLPADEAMSDSARSVPIEPCAPAAAGEQPLDLEAALGGGEWYEYFLSTLATPQGEGVVTRAVEFCNAFEHTAPEEGVEHSAEPDVLAVRRLLGELQQMALQLPLQWAESEHMPDGEAMIRGALERYVMNMLYAKVIGVGRDAVEDKVLAAQMGTLGFLSSADLGVEESCCTGEQWDNALASLALMSRFTSPSDKMECVSAACAHLAAIVDPCDGRFVRLVALAILRAKPPQLYSQLGYISRFAEPDRLWAPALGGSFSIMRAAVEYLATQDPTSFNRRWADRSRASE